MQSKDEIDKIPKLQTNRTYLLRDFGCSYHINISDKDIKIGETLYFGKYPVAVGGNNHPDIEIQYNMLLLIDYQPDKKENTVLLRDGIQTTMFTAYEVSTEILKILQGDKSSLTDLYTFTKDLSLFGDTTNNYIAKDIGNTTYLEGTLPDDLYFEVNTPDKLQRAFSYVYVSDSDNLRHPILNLVLNCDIRSITKYCFIYLNNEGIVRVNRLRYINLIIPNTLEDSNTATMLISDGRFTIQIGYEEFLTHIRQWSLIHKTYRSIDDITTLKVVLPSNSIVSIDSVLAPMTRTLLNTQLRSHLTNHTEQHTYIEALDWYLSRHKPN